ncbi:hypothetical protein ABC795_13595 [Blastococcus sp. HT6-30]|uniref:hypothetical protein n=1 Tax=Blastococcus sp. HT6-30 TaxID=3144843 RepID=UPI00321A885B
MHLVGPSTGGMAQLVAIAHPERVRSLTWIMSTTGARAPVRRTRRRWACSSPRRRPTARRRPACRRHLPPDGAA